jgi:hypothetical protein
MKKGSKHTPESKIKIGLSGIGRKPWNKGLDTPLCVRAKQSKKRYELNIAGEKHYKWAGGCDEYYRSIARRVIARSTRVIRCNQCESILDLVIHHIDKNVKNNSLENLLCLCRGCHTKLHWGDIHEQSMHKNI